MHEFANFLGELECQDNYACGVLSFPDFIDLRTSTSDSIYYYQPCSQVYLHRQVGSRYFVSAANACIIVFLRDAAVEYSKLTGKDFGSKLKCEVFAKLNDLTELAYLKADSIMYYHVYGDLYLLSKFSGLSVMSMNQHYFELQFCLTEVESSPEIVFNPHFIMYSALREGCMAQIPKLTTA